MDVAELRERAQDVPRSPGCYQFLDGETILYVGKAVDLRDRVRSYADPRSERVERMVGRADAIDFAVTDSETQALLLEANLIKRYQPRYNVRLKDDKSYPLVQFTDHPTPRIEITRDPADSARVYGPFTSRGRLERVVKAIRETYGIRGCSDYKFANRNRPCLDYDIGLCSAPCTGKITESAYREDLEEAARFFEGETGVLATPLRTEMDEAAAAQQYERAAHIRDRLAVVETFHSDTAEAVTRDDDGRTIDVLGAALSGERATVARLHSEDGKLVERDRHRVSVPSDAGAGTAAVIGAFIQQYYADRHLPDLILVPEDPGDDDLERWLAAEGVTLQVPGTGRYATLVDLALKNARTGSDPRSGVAALGDAIGMAGPTRIEGFDVSHAQGRSVVGSNVTFVDGEPETAGYRRKKLVEENDDYANMRLLVRWRAERALAGRDDRPDPDLLLIDGGAGQLSAAEDALDATGWDVPVIAIAKADERVITPNGTLSLAADDPGLQLVRRVRDEAHRFAVQYHQSIRDTVSTALEEVDGIGPVTRRRLLRRFGSVEGIRAASTAELQSVEGVGPATAKHIEARL